MSEKKKEESEQSAEKIDDKDRATWDKIVAGTIDAQADSFLKAFTLEYQGKFEEVLDRADLFKKYAKNNVDLDEHTAHMFLEKHEEAMTVKKLRDNLKIYDLDNNRRLCFLEFCLQKTKKTAKDFFYGLAHQPEGTASEALQKAIAAYREALAKKAARQAKMDQLKEEAKQSGVKGKTAQAQLHQMEAEDQLALQKQEITAGAAKRKAEKEAKEDPFVVEQRRVAEIKKKEEEEKKQKADESRKKLAAKAALFNSSSPKDVVTSIGKTETKLNKVTTTVENSALQRDKVQAQVQKGNQNLKKVDAPSTGPSEAVKEAFRKDRAESKTEEKKDK